MQTELVDEETGEVLTQAPPRVVLSQSIVKQLEADYLCPRFYYLYHLSGQHQLPASQAMVKGQRFEYLALGSPNREGEIPEIPKLQNGKKSTDELRIEAQAEVFKQVLPHYKMELVIPEGSTNPSAAISYPLDEDPEIELTGIMDAVIIWEGAPAIMDLKLTASLVSRFGPNGAPGWGDYFNMDHLQAYLYMFLAERIFKRRMRFVYAVFEYGPNAGFKFIEIKDSSLKRREMLRRLQTAKEKLREMEAQGYPRQGHHRQCAKCAERDTCPARQLVPEVVTFD